MRYENIDAIMSAFYVDRDEPFSPYWEETFQRARAELAEARAVPPIHAVARDAAVQIYARAHGPHVMLGTAVEACNSALALVAEMKKHDGFGGGP